MLIKTHNCAAMFVSYFGFCYSFVLISSASAGVGGLTETAFLELGKAWNYEYETRVLLNEKGATAKDVGFSISGDVLVESIWSLDYSRLLKFTLKLPKLLIHSLKEKDEFSSHSSKLDQVANLPFYALWNMGKIEKILLPKEETRSLANIKRGIASLFQFQLLDQEVKENDASGSCIMTYTSLSPNKFTKTKTSCHSTDYPYYTNPFLLLTTKVNSVRKLSYELDQSIQHLVKVQGDELHEVYLTAKEDVGDKVQAYQTLKLKELKSASIMSGQTFDEVYQKLINEEGILTDEPIFVVREYVKNDEKSFSNIISDYKDNLKAKNVGTLASAKSVIPLVRAARRSSKDDIHKALHAKKNQNILHQLMDIMGYAQTMNSYVGVINRIHLDDPKHEELNERYLWAASFASNPNPEIITNLLNKYKKLPNIPDKVKESLLLSIGGMAKRLSLLPNKPGNSKVINAVKEIILNGLDAAKDEERLIFLRALKNLSIPSTLSTLFEIINTGTRKEAVLAWKAIAYMDSSNWTDDVLASAKRTFYQLDKGHDSSARTFALDIILRSNPSDETLKQLILHLLHEGDKAYEVKRYILQQLKLLGDNDAKFAERINNIVWSESKMNNYNVLGGKGLTLALQRRFMDNPSSNGSLMTVQEMFAGLSKRGFVSVILDKNGVSQEIFNLGVFSAGLGALMSSHEVEGGDEVATAGMEMSMFGTQIRPFTFFEGQTELMGHIWSGTASDRMTAYQALSLLQDHIEYLRLSPGFVAEIDIKGAASIDLAGKIELSIWNRNAQSLIEKCAGFVFVGTVKVENSFVSSQVEFMASIEPRLHFETDVDFGDKTKFCMRLNQLDSIFRHNVYKVERLANNKHRLRKVIYRKYEIPGTTYALNKKNTDMCNMLFSS